MEEAEVLEKVLHQSGSWKIVEEAKYIECPTSVTVNGSTTTVHKGYQITIKLCNIYGTVARHSYFLAEKVYHSEDEKIKGEIMDCKMESINAVTSSPIKRLNALRELAGL